MKAAFLYLLVVAMFVFLVCVVIAKWIQTEHFTSDTNNQLIKVPPSIRELGIEPHSLTWEQDEVPMILHQTAPADKSKWHPSWPVCQKSWRDNFSHYTYTMWTDEDIIKFIRERFPRFLPIFTTYDANIKRIDAFRYFLLYDYGGIYADMDYECYKNFQHMLPAGKVSIAESTFAHERFQNALMASPPKHPFWLYVFDALMKNKEEKHPVLATGPHVIDAAIKNAPPSTLNTLHASAFTVIEPNQTLQHTKRTELIKVHDPNVYAAHHCSGAWHP